MIRNQVDDAVAVATVLEEMAGSADASLLFRVGGLPTLHHGRFAVDDRKRLDTEVEAIFGKNGKARRPIVLVGTQTLEQSLDIDADLLISDLAPMDVLLQRIGRLHRHDRQRPPGFETPKAIVLTPADRDLTPFLDRKRERHGLGPLKDGRGVYPDITMIEATWALLEETPEIVIPRDNRRLVEMATHPEALERITEVKSERWKKHAQEQEGTDIYDRQLGQGHSLDTATPFSELLFSKDETIRTRLGANDRRVKLDRPWTIPFGQTLTELRIPGHMAEGLGPEPKVESSGDSGEKSLSLIVDGNLFRYDRFGLVRQGNSA